MRKWFLLLLLLFPSVASAQQTDYFFLFATQAAAQADPVVGSYWNGTSWDMSVCFPGIKVVSADLAWNSINTVTGFWIMISSKGPNSALANAPNMVLSTNRDANALNSSKLTTAGHQSFRISPEPEGSNYHSVAGF